MRENMSRFSVLLLGGCFLAVSLLTGCSFSAEGNGFRFESSPEDPTDEPTR